MQKTFLISDHYCQLSLNLSYLHYFFSLPQKKKEPKLPAHKHADGKT